MPGKCSLVAASLVAVLTTASAGMRPAGAAPSWITLVTWTGIDSQFEFEPATARAAPGVGAQETESRTAPLAASTAPADAPATPSSITNEELCATLVSSARESALPLSFFTNLIWQESRFNPRTISRAGAQGIAQFMPSVSKEVGLADPFDPRAAIPAAAQLLRNLVDTFGNLGLAAAAYNAGPGRVRAWIAKRSKLPGETRHYVATITGRAADTWRGVKSAALAFAMSPAVPCHGVETFAAATRTEQAQAEAVIPSAPSAASRGTSSDTKPGVHVARNILTRRGATRIAAVKLHDRGRRKG